MMLFKRRSLKLKLTRWLIVLQVLTLVIFVFVAAIPISRLTAELALDDRVIEPIAEAIRPTSEGLELIEGKALRQLHADFPTFWFLATDRDGRAVTSGQVPVQVAGLLPYLRYMTVANIGSASSLEIPAAIVRPAKSQAGILHIITGGGPGFEPFSIRQLVANRFFVGLVLFLTIVMVIAIPIVVERELRGLHGAAEEAARIDVHKRGVRLSAKDIPAEMHPLVRAINDALARLDDGFERRQRFLADTAHELRTPIAILQTRIDLLPDEPNKQELLLDVARLANLADQLLDLHRLDDDNTTFEPVDLVELAQEVTGDLAPLAIAAGDEISFESDTGAKAVWVEGDRAALGRALTNLVQNAISHAGKAAQIEILVSRSGSMAVTDSGPGVAESERQRIFEPFYRVSHGGRGAGLGLNLVQDIVSQHNGHISVSDAPKGGARFTIELPLAAAPA